MKDGKVWILGADVLLGLGLSASGRAYARLNDDEKCNVPRKHVGNSHPGKPMVAISESGFNKLVLRSDKPEAFPFQDWVAGDVLPAIRRTGGYRLAGVAPEAVEEGVANAMPNVGGLPALMNELHRALGRPSGPISCPIRATTRKKAASV